MEAKHLIVCNRRRGIASKAFTLAASGLRGESARSADAVPPLLDGAHDAETAPTAALPNGTHLFLAKATGKPTCR
jgi:hypothetical protein